mgnify:CR=1 FL=1
MATVGAAVMVEVLREVAMAVVEAAGMAVVVDR